MGPHTHRWQRTTVAIAFAAAGLALVLPAVAQTTITWANSGSSSLDTAGNWVGSAVPTSSQVALFNSATFSPNGLTPQSSSLSFGGIRLASGAGALTFTAPGSGSAKTLSIGTYGVENLSSNALTFDITSKVNISLSADATFTANGAIYVLDDANHGATSGFSIGAHTLTLAGTSTLSTIEKGFVGAGGKVVKSGTGTWTLTGANSYTGSTTVSGGILSVSQLANGGTDSNIGASSAIASNLVLDGGDLQYTGAAVSIDRLFSLTLHGGTIEASGTGTLTFGAIGTVALSDANSSPTLTLAGSNTGNNTLTPILADTGTGHTSLTKNGAGTWVLAGANTLTGTVTVNAGTLTVSSGAYLGGNSLALTVNGGMLNLNATMPNIGALSGTGGLVNFGTNSGYTLTVTQAVATTFAGALSGSGGFAKSGSGKLTLSGANTYGGSTTVSGGELAVANTTGSATSTGNVTVQSGAVFSGTGSITGALALNSGAAVSPGASVGMLTVGSSTWAGGAGFKFDLKSASGAAGTGWDLLSITGQLTFNANNLSPFTLKLASLDSGGSAGLVTDFNPANTYSWNFVSAGSISGFSADALLIDTSLFQNSLNGGAFSVSQIGSNLALNFNPAAVPEPATWALLGLGGAILLLARRRRST